MMLIFGNPSRATGAGRISNTQAKALSAKQKTPFISHGRKRLGLYLLVCARGAANHLRPSRLTDSTSASYGLCNNTIRLACLARNLSSLSMRMRLDPTLISSHMAAIAEKKNLN